MQVLTSLSGLQFSAASAGFAPTNSADVSAIASSYQVVSSTSTQLHAGTAYLTGVNGAPISASRAGQAANASLSNSAYYDGTGRLISALPDSAAVSAIASSYAESAASGKQDTIEFGYDANNLISSIDGSALAGQGGGGGGLITSIESAIDPWLRTGISGLNGSSLYPKWAESARLADYAAQATSASTAHYAQSAPTAWASSFITGVVSPSGTLRVQGGTAIEATNSALLPSTVIEGFSIEEVIGNTTNTTSFTVPVSNPTTRVHFGDAYGAPGLFAIDTDNGLHFESSIDSYFDVTFDLPNATSFTATYPWVGNLHYTASASYEEEGGGVAELAWASALPTYEYDGDGKISAIDGSALAGGGGATGDYLSAVNVDSNLTGDGTTASPIGLNTKIALDGTSSYIRLTDSAATVPTFAQMVSNKTAGMISVSGNKANIQATGKATANFSFNCDTSGQASMLSGPWVSTTNWAGVSSYYKNGLAKITVRASGSNNPTITLIGTDGNSVIYLSSIPYWNAKLDESASAQFQLSGDYLSATESANYQTTAGMSGYIPTSMSSDFQQATGMSSYALSSDVSGTVDLVSSQSANWGGSALQLSAGPGVTLTKSGNLLVAGLDETVLWSGEGISAGQSTSLSESITAFERIRVYGYTHNSKAFSWTNEQEALSSQIYGIGLCVWQGGNQELDYSRYSVSGSSISALSGSFIANLNPIGMGNSNSWVYKVVGINRTAEA